MITIEELRNRLAERLSETKESQNSMAKRLGIQQSTLSNFLAEKKGLGLEAALVILGDMGYHLCSEQKPTPQGDKSEVEVLRAKVEHLTNERDALKSANKALEKNVFFLEEKLEAERMLEKNSAPQDEGRAARPEPVADIRVDHPAGTRQQVQLGRNGA